MVGVEAAPAIVGFGKGTLTLADRQEGKRGLSRYGSARDAFFTGVATEGGPSQSLNGRDDG